MNWKEYFDKMINWKGLPSYKVEPRVDSFIGFYLKQIIETKYKIIVEGIIPEFPIRKGAIEPEFENTNLSYKVDFLVVGKKDTNYLVEIKTNTSSRNVKQDNYLIKAKKIGTEKIIDGVIKITTSTHSMKKYKHLIDELIKLELLDENYKYTKKNEKIEILYVQPSNKMDEDNIIDFKEISNYLLNLYNKSDFEEQFAQALNKWSVD